MPLLKEVSTCPSPPDLRLSGLVGPPHQTRIRAERPLRDADTFRDMLKTSEGVQTLIAELDGFSLTEPSDAADPELLVSVGAETNGKNQPEEAAHDRFRRILKGRQLPPVRHANREADHDNPGDNGHTSDGQVTVVFPSADKNASESGNPTGTTEFPEKRDDAFLPAEAANVRFRRLMRQSEEHEAYIASLPTLPTDREELQSILASDENADKKLLYNRSATVRSPVTVGESVSEVKQPDIQTVEPDNEKNPDVADEIVPPTDRSSVVAAGSGGNGSERRRYYEWSDFPTPWEQFKESLSNSLYHMCGNLSIGVCELIPKRIWPEWRRHDFYERLDPDHKINPRIARLALLAFVGVPATVDVIRTVYLWLYYRAVLGPKW